MTVTKRISFSLWKTLLAAGCAFVLMPLAQAQTPENGSFNLAPLKEYFQFDSKNKSITYDIVPEFKTSLGEEYALRKTKKAFSTALNRTFSEGALNQLKGHLQKAFIEEFVYTLLVMKLINSRTQIDLHFIPRSDSASDFSPELSSNDFVHFARPTKLSEQIKSNANTDLETTLKELSKSHSINGYVAGVISLQVDIADVDLSNFKSLKDLKHGAVKGMVRLRKYIIENATTQSVDWKHGHLSISEIGTSPRSLDKISTVDVQLNFDLGHLIPKASTINVFPGRLVPVETKENWWWPIWSSLPKGKPLYFQGHVYDGFSSKAMGAYLDMVSYDLRQKTVSTKLRSWGPLEDQDKQQLQGLIERQIRQLGSEILGLDNYLPSLRQP
ncbi:MAG: hypothetical protein H6626_07545 [Pseudobdellovibrionaceae bacterium]|nr:hypothetical protein [Bdellovibrionales bacterium]USN46082.1 MAG: hypothetical protein H6626_07545 [Pseudobdellovibrionaceae bacterium]